MRGVADIRTVISAHYRSTSRHDGTPYLEIMALGLEELRLEKDLEWLGRREERIRKRLAEIKTLKETRVSQVQEDDSPVPELPRHEEQPRARGRWRTMAVEY
jgi:hypothetical protein